MNIRRRIVVTGLVQGVFYRDCCQREAHRLGLGGWVRNRPDGAVEIEAEGAGPAVTKLEEWAARGPSNAYVDQVNATDAQPQGSAEFEVR